MKTIVSALFLLIILSTNAQQINEKGLYTDENGNLFSGIVASINNGVKSETEIKEGVVSGSLTYFFVSGKVMEKGTMKNGLKDGQWIRYRENGTTSAIAFYTLGKKSGTWLVYDENNNKRMEMNYTDGEKSGVWKSWDENGIVLNTKTYGSGN